MTRLFSLSETLAKHFVSNGKQEIEKQIDQHFWSTNPSINEKTTIAYNISIEKKLQKVCSKSSLDSYDIGCTEMAVIVIGTIKAIYSDEDIRRTKLMGRKFVQTFLLHCNNKKNDHYFKTTVLSYLAPTTDNFEQLIKQELPAPTINSPNNEFDEKESIVKTFEESMDDILEFEKIVKNIDHLINETNESKEVPKEKKIESKNNDLLPISVYEILTMDCEQNFQ